MMEDKRDYARCVLVLLVLGDEILHVGLGLGELHLVHTLLGVPMQEGLALEHGRELVVDTLEEFLDRGRVADERRGHTVALGRDITLARLDVVRDPLDEVGRVLGLDVVHLLLDLLHRHLATEHGGDGEVTAVARVRGGHHVLCVEHLLGELRDGDGAELLRVGSSERGKADHEEVQTREGNHVDGELAQIAVELTGEAEGGGDAGHDDGDEAVQVTVPRGGELEDAEADLVEGLVVNAEGLVRVLDKLVDGEGGIVGLDDGVGDLGRRHNGERAHHAVGVLLTNLGDEECAHTSTGTATERVGDLEALQAVGTLGLLADDVEDRVDKLSAFSVVCRVAT